METHLAERHESLWMLALSPTIWAAHFLLCYVTGAIWCAKVPALAPLGGVRTAVFVFTIVALAGIVWNARGGWQRHRLGDAELPHDEDTPEDRTRFLGFATLLLAGLSAIATVFAALVVLYFKDCR